MRGPGMLARRPENVRPDGDPKKMERSARARSELRNAWHGAKAYRETLLPEWAIQLFRAKQDRRARENRGASPRY
jgi:hypothetical protein